MKKDFSEKRLTNFSFIGVFAILLLFCVFCFTGSLLPSALSVILAPVNGSLWESIKCVISCYIIWSAVTLLSVNPPFKKFVVSSVLVLYAAFFAGIILYYALCIPAGYAWWARLAVLLFTVCSMQYMQRRLTLSDIKEENYFALCVFLLLLAVVCVFCFSVAAPKLPIFFDSELGIYGIVPDYFDAGAVFLDKTVAV